jgi:hypothetical protein
MIVIKCKSIYKNNLNVFEAFFDNNHKHERSFCHMDDMVQSRYNFNHL